MSELSPIEEMWLMVLPFEGQRWYHQLPIIAGGIGLWLATFAAMVSVTGNWTVATADTSAGISLRQQAGFVAAFVSTSYYLLLFIRGYGGLCLSSALYPVLTFVLMLSLIPRVFGTPHPPFTTGERLPRTLPLDAALVFLGIFIPITMMLGGFVLYSLRQDDPDRVFTAFVDRLPDVQIRVLCPIQPDMSPELKRVIREAHRSSTDDQDDDDARANT